MHVMRGELNSETERGCDSINISFCVLAMPVTNILQSWRPLLSLLGGNLCFATLPK